MNTGSNFVCLSKELLISSKKDPLVNPSRNRLKTLSWQERRKLERERKQQEEDEQTLAKVEGLEDPVGIEILRSRAGVGLEDPHKEKRKKEENMMNMKKMWKEEDLMKEFGSRQKSQWQSKRVIINYNKTHTLVLHDVFKVNGLHMSLKL
ncbi:uncharacterized protein LOC111240809 [Vigna radiata var. radiata]|uniref:Uncharacterized protein LOC111240809 n=1 Tax=Vigna radiata var. radiata TaxID=3916 RepID=A0A3Q0EMJ1_VIGRR|nr:uncharacterized protein LOC111240809 [Vigna radiata var. radiata]